ncbi:hypothetical protein M8J76_015885 [Diaphorina citri]|nr:hypothetical protein M8J76_015885 [Diaphorina citri]
MGSWVMTRFVKDVLDNARRDVNSSSKSMKIDLDNPGNLKSPPTLHKENGDEADKRRNKEVRKNNKPWI